MPNPLPTPGVKGRLFFSNTGDNGGNCLAVDTGSDWKRIVLDNSVGATDSKISEMESDMSLLASQVSLGNVRVSLGNLANRVTSLESSGISGGISGISNAVSWTNLSEINLSGEKLVNGDFLNTTDLPDKLIATGSATNCYVRQEVSVNGTYVQSIEIKEALASGNSSFMLDQYFSRIQGRNRIRINLNGSSAPTVSVLNHGDVNNVTVTSLADDFYRIDLQITLSNGYAQIRFGALRTGDEVFARNASLKASGSTTELLTSNSSFSSGWFRQNTTVAPGSGVSLDNWSVHSGTLDQTKLASGIVKGDGGAVAIQQSFSNGIAQGTALVCKVTRNDISSDSVSINALRANGSPFISGFIQPSDGFIEFTTTESMYGLRLSTNAEVREVSDISLFQGEVSGGTVQAYAGGGLEKISGVDGFNAGASSSQKIDGNSDGYVQFQIAQTGKDIKIGLVYADVDFADADPFEITFSGTDVSTDGSVRTTYAQGDFFRIRHYASTNEVKYQKRQTVGNGQDYVTFHTANTLSNGSDLYVDTSFHSVGARINDVTIVT